MRVDDLSVTEPAATSELVAAVGQPSPASGDESATAVTQPTPIVTSERCAQCTAPLAPDQRYCLHCGAPRAHVNGPISGGRPGGPSPQTASPSQAASPSGVPQSPPPGAPGVPLGTPPGFSAASTANRNNTLALLAGVGVLLLAMGVGVLIGRASAGTAKVPPAQVISVGGAADGSATTATTPTTPTTETPAASTAKKTAKAKVSSSSPTGSSISKPAPPTVLKSVSKGQSGSSYEQKSKNLPDVVETG
ncbi:MAG TPA: hypothetical protein VK691_12990 [Solirubrobacteraceae bacterium]|jgi:hypothetical protein|nr:hypothetical protein [Solirubrobacteraceae bacterium]